MDNDVLSALLITICVAAFVYSKFFMKPPNSRRISSSPSDYDNTLTVADYSPVAATPVTIIPPEHVAPVVAQTARHVATFRDISPRQQGELPRWWHGTVNTLSHRNPDKVEIPHIMICGKTGSGKSLLALAFMSALSYIPGAKIVILDPHASPHWQMPEGMLVGKYRNFAAIAKAIIFIRREFRVRLNEYADGKRDFDPTFIFIDETPAIKSELEAVFTEFLKMMARESRKVNMHLVVLTQSKLVKSLGIGGEGDIREAFIKWLLNQQATRLMPEYYRANPQRYPMVLDVDEEYFPVDRSFVPYLAAQKPNPACAWIFPDLPAPEDLDDELNDAEYFGQFYDEDGEELDTPRVRKVRKQRELLPEPSSLVRGNFSSKEEVREEKLVFNPVEIARITAEILSGTRTRTEIIKGMPRYHGAKFKEYGEFYDELYDSVKEFIPPKEKLTVIK